MKILQEFVSAANSRVAIVYYTQDDQYFDFYVSLPNVDCELKDLQFMSLDAREQVEYEFIGNNVDKDAAISRLKSTLETSLEEYCDYDLAKYDIKFENLVIEADAQRYSDIEDFYNTLYDSMMQFADGGDILQESTNKLTVDDLKQYPYKFYKVWRSQPNPTYGDDFLWLAEKHNCLQVYRADSREGKWFICKTKEDYESLKSALENDRILTTFLSMTPLRDADWDSVIQKWDKITVDRYEKPYVVKLR